MKKVVIFILLGFSMLLLAGCQPGTVVNQNQNQNQNLNESADPFGDWQDYQGDLYELKYPQDYQKEEPVSDVLILRPSQGEEYLQVQVFNSEPRLDMYKPNGAESVGEVMIGGKDATKYFTEEPIGEGVLNAPYTCYVIVLAEKEWVQIYYYGSGDLVNTFENIVSSFGFVDLQAECCEECKAAFNKSPVGVGAEAVRCGEFSTAEPLSGGCETYFQDNLITVSECE